MAHTDFIRRNGILILGLALPILVMAFFFLASIMPLHVANPPLYDMIFTVQDYSSNSQPPELILVTLQDNISLIRSVGVLHS
ncbi:hypothetical protein [Legionella quateirensis]|uniref:Uncharacterized protein n=1 Tax=Legionella quateirensis TaxID=45072 RepID=A0A378L4M3_9GAMM|nr:hypothetical protein [Legionella quateirensis]KTD52668.1 hypothetical protein Lqua_0501 [Legionella quateirensis]STY19080.1 Uncharacterised protein [Legionella quateirensis]